MKKMQRREFSTALVGAGALALGLPAAAQGGPVEGTHYVRLGQPLPVTAPAGKVEVVEFFWYGCPHCNALEPSLKDWVRRLPADVAFRKVHVGLGPSWVPHQQMYYALDAMGRTADLNEKVFHALHVERLPLDKPDKMADFVAKAGVDRKQFLDTYESFAVRTKMRKASQQADAYKVDGVPAMAVNGRWYTAPSMAGGNEQALRVLDFLIELERKAGRK